MKIQFSKYQGTGNDFIMIDNRTHYFPLSNQQLVEQLCNRRFGIGADGLILLDQNDQNELRMTYFNADGKTSSMCGNGGRCFAAFARQLNFKENTIHFEAIDGEHESEFTSTNPLTVKLKMLDVKSIEHQSDHFFLDTGSPHYVKFVKDVKQLDVVKEGRAIRYSDRFKEKGTNVNFVQPEPDKLVVRTYERGVEDETFSCGTGVTAAVLAAVEAGMSHEKNRVQVQTLGGELTVHFTRIGNGFENVWLEGPATYVFSGELEI